MNEASEEHILFECSALSRLRTSLHGIGFLPNVEAAAKIGYKMFQFAKKDAIFFNIAPGCVVVFLLKQLTLLVSAEPRRG